MKKKLLVFLPYYLPGVKGGGPIRSIEGMVYHLKNIYDIYVYTSNKDFGDEEPYKNVEYDRWLDTDGYHVYYSSTKKTFGELSRIVKDVGADKIYLNDFFDFQYSIKIVIMKKLGLISNDIVLACRGEFSKGAIEIKKIKKMIFIQAVKFLRLYSNIIWHASSELEKADILKQFPKAEIKVAMNLSKPTKKDNCHKVKEGGKVDLVFLSRISPKKNLKFALEVLQRFDGKASFDIYGPLEDREYWRECEALIDNMPSNIRVEYKGCIENENVIGVLANYDFLFFPTLGENYGHVIRESFSAGTPVIISDQTPWRNLASLNIGFDVSGFKHESYLSILQEITSYGEGEHCKMSTASMDYIQEIIANKDIISDNIALFSF